MKLIDFPITRILSASSVDMNLVARPYIKHSSFTWFEATGFTWFKHLLFWVCPISNLYRPRALPWQHSRPECVLVLPQPFICVAQLWQKDFDEKLAVPVCELTFQNPAAVRTETLSFNHLAFCMFTLLRLGHKPSE